MRNVAVVMYHSRDFDGKCAGAIALRELQRLGRPVRLIPWDYGKPIPWDDLLAPDVEQVHVLDLCLDDGKDIEALANMRRLHSEKGLVWIDHHTTAVAAAEKAKKAGAPPDGSMALPFDPLGIRSEAEAACVLTWQYWHLWEAVPWAVQLLGDYDMWRIKKPDVLAFQYGMRVIRNLYSEDPYWDSFIYGGDEHPLGEEVLLRGSHILGYVREFNASCARSAFNVTWEGYRCLALNVPRANSQVFDSVWNPEIHDLMLAFSLRDDLRWQVVLFTTRDDVDCSALAAKHGGGGHRKAAGFVADFGFLERVVSPAGGL